MPYFLSCQICTFQDTADSVDEAFDIIEAHQEEQDNDHFVEFEKIEEEPLLRGGNEDSAG